MKSLLKCGLISAAITMAVSPVIQAEPLLNLGDFIIAIDTDNPDLNETESSYPAAENPANAIDGKFDLVAVDGFTKYLNFGVEDTGFIVTPSGGASVVKSLRLYTANDAVERDPTSFALYGTNSPIVSADNSRGQGEDWTLIATGPLTPPLARAAPFTADFAANTTSYTSYRLTFPTLRFTPYVPDSMQIGEAQLFTEPGAAGTNVLVAGSPIIAVDTTIVPASRYPAGEGAQWAINNLPGSPTGPDDRYRNLGKFNSGFIVTPWVGPTVVKSFQITTGWNAPDRDPTEWALYGTNDSILSIDNSQGNLENWTLIGSGAVALPTDRKVLGPVVEVANDTAYSSYRMIFTNLRNTDPPGDPALIQAMHVGEIQFEGTILNPQPTPLLNPGDPIIAIDVDTDASASNSPGAEIVTKAIDGSADTKYLNFAKENSGFIVTPSGGASVVKSLRLTTANDAVERDPASFELYGTNDPITSTNNSRGNKEAWTLIASNTVTLPDNRNTAGDPVDFAENSASYTSYRLIFPTLRDTATANSMQIAEVELFTGTGASGTDVLTPTSAILAIDTDPAPTSSYPDAENPPNAIDRTSNKYLNTGNINSGFIVTPSVGPTVVTALRFTSANDAPERDPMAWTLYGTQDQVTSADNSLGNNETWVEIGSGVTSLPEGRLEAGPLVPVTNAQHYEAYRLVFTALRNADITTLMQIGEVQFYGTIITCPHPFADADGDTDVDQLDFAELQLCAGRTGLTSIFDCKCFDREGNDGDVDLADVLEFAKCATGPAIPWSQALTPDCQP